MPTLLKTLEEVRFTRLQLRLAMEDDFVFDLPALLQLRRELRLVAELLTMNGEEGLLVRLHRLLKPAAFDDPVARRRFRQPAPAYVFGWPESGAHRLLAGDELLLPVSLWGYGRSQVGDLLRLFEALGQIGLHQGQGRFCLRAVEVSDGLGGVARVWESGEPLAQLETPYSDLGWWLGQRPPGDRLRLEFRTPARVLSGNRPLFRPRPAELFAAMLRRVTGMIYAWSGVELPIEPRRLLDQAADLQPVEWRLRWRDWRVLTGEAGSQELGGLCGGAVLEGAILQEIGWVMQLCELLNLGRGAAYAGGCCRVSWE